LAVIQSELIRIIFISHLLQPPLTLLLASARGLDLRAALAPKTPFVAQILQNMALAAVCLPTALGLLLALHPAEALRPGVGRSVAVLLSAFWCWRLYRQLFVLGPAWPKTGGRAAGLHPLLVAIFVTQGPVLGLLLLV
jgi:hypothetical protein